MTTTSTASVIREVDNFNARVIRSSTALSCGALVGNDDSSVVAFVVIDGGSGAIALLALDFSFDFSFDCSMFVLALSHASHELTCFLGCEIVWVAILEGHRRWASRDDAFNLQVACVVVSWGLPRRL